MRINTSAFLGRIVLATILIGTRAGASLKVTEETMGKVPRGATSGQGLGPVYGLPTPPIVFSPDQRHWACSAPSPEGSSLIIDGQPRGTFPNINAILFTSAGKIIIVAGPASQFSPGAKPAQRTAPAFVVVDGAKGPVYERIQEPDNPPASENYASGFSRGLTVSPDGKRIAYVGARRGADYLVLDSKERGPYTIVSHLCFSDDSSRFGCIVRRGPDGSDFILFDGTEIPTGGTAFGLLFSPNGRSWGAVVRTGTDQSMKVMVRGELKKDFKYFGQFLFSPNSRHIVSRGGVLSVDGKELGNNLPAISTVDFSADGNEIIYSGSDSGAFDLAGKEILPAKRRYLMVSPSGRRIIYMTDESPGGGWTYDLGSSKLKFKSRPMMMGKAFGPDDRMYMTIARDELSPTPKFGTLTLSLTVEDEIGPPYQAIDMNSLGFNHSGDQFAYAVEQNDKWLVIIGREELKERYDRIAPNPIHFEDGRMRFLAVRNNSIVSVVASGIGGGASSKPSQ